MQYTQLTDDSHVYTYTFMPLRVSPHILTHLLTPTYTVHIHTSIHSVQQDILFSTVMEEGRKMPNQIFSNKLIEYET